MLDAWQTPLSPELIHRWPNWNCSRFHVWQMGNLLNITIDQMTFPVVRTSVVDLRNTLSPDRRRYQGKTVAKLLTKCPMLLIRVAQMIPCGCHFPSAFSTVALRAEAAGELSFTSAEFRSPGTIVPCATGREAHKLR